MSSQEFGEKLLVCSTSLRSFALYLTRDMEEADDLLQETHYRALSNQDKFSDGTNFKAWLFTIMKNIFINNYRRKTRRNTIIDSTDNQYFINYRNRTSENKAPANMLMEEMQNAIKDMSEEYRKPFMMHYRGFKYLEIA